MNILGAGRQRKEQFVVGGSRGFGHRKYKKKEKKIIWGPSGVE